MKKNKKTTRLALIFFIMGVLSLLPATKLQAEELPIEEVTEDVESNTATTNYISGDFTYTVANGEATITKYSGTATELTIPTTLGTFPVVNLGVSSFAYNKNLETIHFNNNLKTITGAAFEACTKLKEIDIPESVTFIGTNAFSCCSSLAKVYIPDNTQLDFISITNELGISDNVVFEGCVRGCIIYASSNSYAKAYYDEHYGSIDNHTKYGFEFYNTDLVPLTGFSLPTEIVVLDVGDTYDINTDLATIPSNADWSDHRFAGKYLEEIDYYGIDIDYITGKVIAKGECTFEVYAYRDVSNSNALYMPNRIESNRLKIQVIDSSKINATSLDIKYNSNSLNNQSIQIDKSKQSTMKLVAGFNSVDVNEGVTWVSSNTNVATVVPDNAKGSSASVNIVNTGTTTFTAKTNRSGIVATFTLTVVNNGADKIYFKDNLHDITLKVNETYKLPFIVEPSSNSGDANFNLIDAGSVEYPNFSYDMTTQMVKGLKVGTGTIKIYVKGKNGYLSSDCKVTVVSDKVVSESITVSKTSLTLNPNETYQLSASILPENSNTFNKVIWATKSKNITVSSDGLVTALAAGTAVVYARSSEYDSLNNDYPYNHEATCTITVNGVTPTTPSQPQIVSSISLNKNSMDILAGKTSSDLKATSNTNVSWTSNNTNICTVDGNGTITALREGSAIITASTTDGKTSSCTINVYGNKITLNANSFNLQKGKSTSALCIASSNISEDTIASVTSSNSKILKASLSNGSITLKGLKVSNSKVNVIVTMKSGATATCKVKVVKDKVTVSKLKLSQTKLTMKKGEAFTLSISATPISTTDKITWSSSNKKIATINKNGKIVAKKKGTVTITAKAASGKKVSCKVKITN